MDYEEAYLKQATKRLTKVAGDALSDDELVSLQTVLLFYAVTFDDGYVLNDHRHDYSTLGYVNAACIVAPLDEMGRTYFEVERMYSLADHMSVSAERNLHLMLGKILTSRGVSCISRYK